MRLIPLLLISIPFQGVTFLSGCEKARTPEPAIESKPGGNVSAAGGVPDKPKSVHDLLWLECEKEKASHRRYLTGSFIGCGVGQDKDPRIALRAAKALALAEIIKTIRVLVESFQVSSAEAICRDKKSAVKKRFSSLTRQFSYVNIRGEEFRTIGKESDATGTTVVAVISFLPHRKYFQDYMRSDDPEFEEFFKLFRETVKGLSKQKSNQ